MGTASDKHETSINENGPFWEVLEGKKEMKWETRISVSNDLPESCAVKSASKNETESNETLNNLVARVAKGGGDTGRMVLDKTQTDDKVESKNLDSNTNLKIRENVDNADTEKGDFTQITKDETVRVKTAGQPEVGYKEELSKRMDLKCDSKKMANVLGGNEIPSSSHQYHNGSALENNLPGTSHQLENNLNDRRHFSTRHESDDSTDEVTAGKTNPKTPELSKGTKTFAIRYSFPETSTLRAQGNADLDMAYESSVLKEKLLEAEVVALHDLDPETRENKLERSPDIVVESSFRTADEDAPSNVSATSLQTLLTSEEGELSNQNESHESPNLEPQQGSSGDSGGRHPTSTLPEKCVLASEFTLSPTKRSPNLEAAAENHYYSNQYGDNNGFEEIYSTEAPGENDFYEGHPLGNFWNVKAEGRRNAKGHEMQTFKQQLVDLQISLNKARIGADFKLKTIIADLRNDFEYGNALVSGALDTLQAMSSVEERREIPSPVFSDVSYEDQWPIVDNEKGASSGATQPTKLHDGSPQNSEQPNAPFYSVPFPSPPYNYGLTGPPGYSRMALPTRMHHPPSYYGYVPRAKYQAPHQPPFMFGPNVRGPGHHQFPPPNHFGRMPPPPKSNSMPNSSHSSAGAFFQSRNSNADTSTQTSPMPAPGSSYYSSGGGGGGTPFPQNHRSNSRPTSSSQSVPATNNSYIGGPPFPKRPHAMPPATSRPPGAGTAPTQKTSASSKENDDDDKPKMAVKEKPKKKTSSRKRAPSKPHQGKMIP